MNDGTFPSLRHDGSPFGPGDAQRAERSGEQLMFRSCLIHIKGDWSEYAHTLGFPVWNDHLRPCYNCNSSGDDLYTHEGASPVGMPFRCNKEEEYFEDCTRCEVVVVITSERVLGLVVRELARRPGSSRSSSIISSIISGSISSGGYNPQQTAAAAG
jgi:hypothetical protein